MQVHAHNAQLARHYYRRLYCFSAAAIKASALFSAAALALSKKRSYHNHCCRSSTQHALATMTGCSHCTASLHPTLAIYCTTTTRQQDVSQHKNNTVLKHSHGDKQPGPWYSSSSHSLVSWHWSPIDSLRDGVEHPVVRDLCIAISPSIGLTTALAGLPEVPV